MSKNVVRDGADFVCANFDADGYVREEVRETIGPPTTLATLLLEIPDLFENEIIWRLTTGDLKRFVELEEVLRESEAIVQYVQSLKI